MQKLIFKENDKPVLVIPARDQTMEELIENSVPVGHEYALVDEEKLPENYLEWWNAIVVDFSNQADPLIRIDIELAKEMTKQRLRAERQTKFEINDVALRDAMLDDNTILLKKAKDERDRLRNITQLVDECGSLEELKNINV